MPRGAGLGEDARSDVEGWAIWQLDDQAIEGVRAHTRSSLRPACAGQAATVPPIAPGRTRAMVVMGARYDAAVGGVCAPVRSANRRARSLAAGAARILDRVPRAEPSDESLEWVVPLPTDRRRITDAKHFRSTWLASSQASLRERGLGARYESLLDPKYKDQILGAVPGMWLPMDVARAHYLACDSLELSQDTLLEMGRAATQRAHGTTLSVVVRLAQGGGVTPWTALSHGGRLWERTCDGGAIGIARLGPKEARIDMLGFPLAGIRYNRVTLRGIVASVAQLFCTKAYAKEVTSLCGPNAVVLRLSWV